LKYKKILTKFFRCGNFGFEIHDSSRKLKKKKPPDEQPLRTVVTYTCLLIHPEMQWNIKHRTKGHVYTKARCISKLLIMQIQQKLYKFMYYSLLQATNTMQNLLSKNEWIFFKNLQTMYNKFHSTWDNA
jgi:hypothetical protein